VDIASVRAQLFTVATPPVMATRRSQVRKSPAPFLRKRRMRWPVALAAQQMEAWTR